MSLYQNEMMELYNPEDFEPQRRTRVSDGPARKEPPKPTHMGRKCAYCGGKMPEHAHGRALYCCDKCRYGARKLRDSKR